MGFTNALCFRPPSTLASILEADAVFNVPPSTRMACTLGPESRTVEVLEALLQSGMTIARFDFSFGTREYHQETLQNLKTAMHNTKRLCGVMVDTMGPEIVVVNRPSDCDISIEAGQTITLTCDKSVKASSSVLPISYPTLAGSGIQPGAAVFVGQYLFTGSETSSVYLTVQSIEGDSAVCICNNTCKLTGIHLTVHVADLKNTSPILSDEDLRYMELWAKPNNIDFVSLSFCRSSQDVVDCRAVLDRLGLISTQILAKIETREGLVNFDEILAAADGLIFSRGNLGICLDPEKVFLAQKMVLKACNMAGKPVLVTRVVDTMTEAPRPTRAEATDVANLVLDGADGILLGSETFRGKYPVNTVKTVLAICRQAEHCFDSYQWYTALMESLGAFTLLPRMSKAEATASSAVRAAGKVGAALIIIFTVTGRTARIVAKYRPKQPILTVCVDFDDMLRAEHRDSLYELQQLVNVANAAGGPQQPEVVTPTLVSDGLKWTCTGEGQARQCLLYRGCLPITADPSIGSPDGAILHYAVEKARNMGLVKSGDKVVVCQCPRSNMPGPMAEAGVFKIMTVDEDLTLAPGPRAPHVVAGAMGVAGTSPTASRVASGNFINTNDLRYMGSTNDLAALQAMASQK